MSLDLTKKVDMVKLDLSKKGINRIPPVRVGSAFDISGSMGGRYRRGVVQRCFDQLLGVAVALDDDGQLDAWAFNTRTRKIGTATAADYGTYVTKNITPIVGGGTCYTPCFKDVLDFFFPPAKNGFFGLGKSAAASGPALLLFLTDGDVDYTDQRTAERVLVEAQSKNIYFHMVGIGNDASFTFLKDMADKYPNVGFIQLSGNDMTDEQIYAEIVNDEFAAWLKKF